MSIFGLPIRDVVLLAFTLAIGVMYARKAYKEYKARENGLAPNPARCEDHEGRLRKVETFCAEVSPKIDGMKESVDELKNGVNKLIDLHIKP